MNELTYSDIANCISAMKLAYKSQFAYTDSEVPQLAELWYNTFKGYPREVVMAAMNEAMQECEFIPTLSQICKRIKATTQVFTITPLDLWNDVLNELPKIGEAVRDIETGSSRAWNDSLQEFDDETYAERGIKLLGEIFERFSPEVKRYFGNRPERLVAFYNMTAEERGFEKARFLKSVQPFIDQQETADKVGAGDFFNQLTAGTLKALSEGK